MEKTGKNVSVRRIIGYMIVVMLIISVLLLTAAYRTAVGYEALNENVNIYAQWQRDANDLQRGSDYLTEQVRCFVVTGERQYLDNYFEEADVTRRRDKAVESVRQLMGETEAYRSLVSALGESIDLMNREYYAMRLAVSAYGEAVEDYPQPIRDVALSEADAAASPEAQREAARMMVFDDIYRGKKDAISENIQNCLDAMDAEIEAGQRTAEEAMRRTLRLQRAMIIASILAFVATFLLFMLLVVTPLLKAVTYIQKDQSIPIEGSKEFQFLAKAYNVMHRTNMEQKQELAYEATHDNLTGVYNRNGYEAVQRGVDWSRSALVLFDLDHFKPINDNYGHKVGDQVLARTARVIQNAFRAQDFVCRIGGDEFAVIMTQVNTDSGPRIVEKVARINAELGKPQGDVPAIQTSCGVAYGALISDFDVLFREADAALYRIKNNGGGGCEIVA